MRQRPTGRIPVQRELSAGTDRRRSQRIALGVPATLEGGARSWDIEVLELSRNGARLCGRGAFDVGHEVVLVLATPGSPLRLPGRVVWVDRARRRVAGIDFTALDPAQRAALEAAVAALGHALPGPRCDEAAGAGDAAGADDAAAAGAAPDDGVPR